MSRSALLRVAVAIVGVLVVAAGGVAATGEDRTARPTVVGYFDDASPLEVGSEVRASGVHVGNVRDIALEGDKARVTLDVERSVLPLHRDATMKLRPVNLLGEQYIELDVGSPDEPFMDQPVVPAERTESSVGLDELFNTFDDPTSTALAAMITTLGEGMHDSGADAAAAIEALAPAMRQANELGAVLREQNTILNQLVKQAEPVANALADRKGKTLDRLVASTERMMSTLAAREQAVKATLDELPATMVEARRTLDELAGMAAAATPTLKSVRPITENLSEITGELHRFADAADPALASLEPVLKRADELLAQAAPVVERLRKAGPDLRETAEQLRPLGDVLLDEQLGDLMAFVKKWSLSTNGRDALGHYFRGVVHVTPTTLEDYAAQLGLLQEDADAGSPQQGSQDPKPSVAQPDLDETVGGALPGITGKGGADSGNATGLTPKQEQSMLDQLLGGR